MRSASPGVIIGPQSVSGRAGSPVGNAAVAAARASRSSSAISSWTSTRWTEMHDCPAYAKAPAAIRFATVSRSPASGSTITAALPPSSSATLRSQSFRLSSQPMAADPVNVTSRTRESSSRASASAPRTAPR